MQSSQQNYIKIKKVYVSELTLDKKQYTPEILIEVNSEPGPIDDEKVDTEEEDLRLDLSTCRDLVTKVSETEGGESKTSFLTELELKTGFDAISDLY